MKSTYSIGHIVIRVFGAKPHETTRNGARGAVGGYGKRKIHITLVIVPQINKQTSAQATIELLLCDLPTPRT